MDKSLNDLYWSLRNHTQQRLQNNLFSSVQFRTDLPADTDFTAPPLSALDHPWFYHFMAHPQIGSLLREALDYLFLYHNQGSEKLPNLAPLERTCNYCLEALETFHKLDNEQVSAFRKFWELLMLPPVIKGTKKVLEDSYIFLFHSISVIAGQETAKNLDRMLKEKFILLNGDYKKIRQRYQMQLKSYYQKGFIYLLGEFDFNDFYIPPQLISGSSEQFICFGRPSSARKRDTSKNLFQKHDIVYIIGVPGSGKSLFLRNLINNYDSMSFPGAEDYLVIYCDMKTYYTNGDSNQKSIPDFLQETIINTTGMEKADISLDFIRYHLQLGRCLILMDALDEVPKSNRLALHKMVVSYFKGVHPDNKLCITSRARGFLPQEHIEVLRISNLTEKDISNYLDKMIALGKFKAEDKTTFLSQAGVLIEKEFLTNFLILSLMVNIYKAERKLPENKVELYKKCFEYIAKKREMEKGSKISYDWELLAPLMKESTFISLSTLGAPNNMGISRDKIEEMLLEQYQYKYTDQARTENAIRQFLDFCSNRTDLFVLADSDETFRFFHRSFFEYFYSRYITQQPKVEEMYRLMSKFDEDSEVFELTLALVKEDNERMYQKLVQHIFARVNKEFHFSKPKYTAFKILTLSMQVIDDSMFHQKYLSLVMDYPKLMVSASMRKMNQRPIIASVNQALEEFPDLVPRFQEIYETEFIFFIMRELGEIPQTILKHILDESQNLQGEFLVSGTQKSFCQTDFWVLAYPQQKQLRDRVVAWNTQDFDKFRAALSSTLEKGSRILKGVNYFASCRAEHRKILWDFIIQHQIFVEKHISSLSAVYYENLDVKNIIFPTK